MECRPVLPLALQGIEVEGALPDGEPLLGERPRVELPVELFRVRVDPEPLQEVLGVPSVSKLLAPLVLPLLRIPLAVPGVQGDERDRLELPDYEEPGLVPVVACVGHELLHLEA